MKLINGIHILHSAETTSAAVKTLNLSSFDTNPDNFISIEATLAAITDNSSSNPYIIKLGPGIYIENTLTMKPYVSIVGDSYTSTIIQVDATSKDVIIGADQSSISNVTLRGATDSGKCAIKYSSSSGIATAFFYVDSVRFGANNVLVKAIGTAAQITNIQCSNIRYDISGYSTGFWATYDGISGSSTIQLRSATTTASMGVSTTQTVFGLADAPSCQIVTNSAQVNKSGATSGIAFQVINGGSLRLTSTNIRNWAKGIDMPNTGAATNISAVGTNFESNTEDVNVAHTSATGKIENADYAKTTIIDTSNVYILGFDIRTIKVRKKGGDYTSVVAALASITDNSTTKRYVIDVGAGVFIETLIDLSTKPYVNITGQTINSTIIEASASNHHIIKVGTMNEVSFLSIKGSGSGFAGVHCSNGGDFSQLHKIAFENCDIGCLIENTTTDSEFYGEYVDFSGTFSYGVKVSNTSTGLLFVNFENTYCFPDSGLVACYEVVGANADFHLTASGNENATIAGNGIVWHTGATLDISATYFYSFTTAISMPNTGAAPEGHFIGVKTENCTTDINIAHTSGQGSFQGAMDNPVISIASAATFGIQYMESLLGNKKEIYFDTAGFNLIAGATPTTSAATRTSLTNTGFTFLSFPGANNSNAGASVNFRIPKDYLRNGRFKVIWTSETGTNPMKLQFIVTKKVTGENMATTTETGLSITYNATTQYNVQESTWITSSTTYATGDTVSIRVYRLGNDAADTFTGRLYIQGLVFEYESHK